MNSSRYFRLGLFVLTGTALLFAGVVALGAGSIFKRTIAAETYSDEPVSGLEAGSVVKYRGVPVGKVKQIRLVGNKYAAADPGGELTRQILIEFALDVDIASNFDELALRTAVANGLRAKLVQSMITGSAYVALDFVDPGEHPAPTFPWRPESVYIPSVPSTGTIVVNSVERLMGQLQKVDLPATVRRLDDLLDNANRSLEELKVAEIRKEGIALLSEVRGSNARIRQLLDDPALEAAWHDLPQITGRVRSAVARVEEILNDKRLDQVLAGLADAAKSAGPAAADAKQLLRDVRALVASEQDNMRSIIADLTTTAANLKDATQDAKANPSRLLLERPPARRKPGE